MNLQKLFDMQKVLRDRINYNEPDRFNKLILALLVELGECANEWRGFKFWSQDQEPRIIKRVDCFKCSGTGFGKGWLKNCRDCNGSGKTKKNPLLEEYVDGLHFVLELGIDFGFEKQKPFLVHTDFEVEKMFLKIHKIIFQFSLVAGRMHKEFYYGELLNNYFGLGKMLGFTYEQIEQAYIEKNKVNHERQDSGTY